MIESVSIQLCSLTIQQLFINYVVHSDSTSFDCTELRIDVEERILFCFIKLNESLERKKKTGATIFVLVFLKVTIVDAHKPGVV